MIKVIIAGGRDFDDRNQMDDALARCMPLTISYTVISGAAKGADHLWKGYKKEY